MALVPNLRASWIAVAALWVPSVFGTQPNDVTIDTPPPPIQFEPWREIRPLDDPSEFRASFPSPYRSGVSENDTVHLSAYLPEGANGPVPAVVVLHYLGADDLRPTRILAEELNRRGLAAVLLTLPYHVQRAPQGSRSGELAISSDPSRLKAFITQSTLDVRRTLDFLQTRPEVDSKRIGIAGISLGAVVASLAYSSDDRLQHASFILGGGDLAHILWNSSLTTAVRDEMRRNGLNEDSLRTALTDIEPLSRIGRKTSGRAFLIGGLHDTVIPHADAVKLAEAAPNCETLWIGTGHYGGVFVLRRVARTVSQFFREELDGRQFAPPVSLYAPTVRLGVLGNTATGIQIGVGLDLFQTGKDGAFFGTALATPDGPMLFLGHRFGGSLAFGGFATPSAVGAGFYWSVVL